MISTYELPYDDKSHEALERAIAVLGGTQLNREIVGKIYALGRVDGRSEMLDELQKATA